MVLPFPDAERSGVSRTPQAPPASRPGNSETYSKLRESHAVEEKPGDAKNVAGDVEIPIARRNTKMATTRNTFAFPPMLLTRGVARDFRFPLAFDARPLTSGS